MRKIKTKALLSFAIFCSILLSAAMAQTIPVKGHVADEKGQALGGVSVVLTGTDKGTVTNSKGDFTLNANADATLTISLIGYEPVTVSAQPTLSISLKRGENTLTDVVVIGYGSVRRQALTGSVATVGQKDFQKGVITTPEQLIAGKIAGVSITSNGGSPGAGSVVRIRQGASLTASNDPLIVIDGLPLSGNNIYGASNPLSLINPNDIETFTVLKDAAATAIYGNRASNGVILITTKKGSGKTPKISFSTQLSVATIAKKMDVQSADEFRRFVDSTGGGTYDGTHTFKSLLGAANTDWQDEIFQKAVSTDNNISVSGAVKNVPYRVSLGYLNQNGILKTDNLERFSGAISLSPNFFDNHLKVQINVKGTVSNARFANGAAISSAVYFDPTQPVHAPSPYGDYFEWASSGTLNKLAPRNPVALLDLYHNNSDVKRSFGNIQLDYSFHFLPELHANLNLGYDLAKGEGKINVPAYAAQNFLDTGLANKYSNRINNKVSEFYFSYIKDLKGIKSNINAVAGYGYYNNLSTNDNYASFRANGDTMPGTKPLFAVDKPENTLLSFYGRLIYTYNNKYILSATMRGDASSRYSKDTRWGYFPSVALTWKLKNESFLSHANALSLLNLRLSYGKTGNQDGVNNYPYQAVYSLSGNGSLQQFGNDYYSMGTPAAYDADIKWEETETYNAGIDYGFFKNRITGSVDAYFKKTKDLLYDSNIPAGSNFSTRLLTNVGNVENKGVEFLINADVIQKKRYNWSVGFNAAYNENEVKNLLLVPDPSYAGGPVNNQQINTVGYQIQSFYVYKQEYLNGRPVEGVYQDLNHDGIINQNDKYHFKSPFPKWVFGFSTQFTYDKWTISTVLRANVGNYMYNGIYVGAVKSNILNPLGYLANTISDIKNTGFTYGQELSDYYIENASFLKMDNVGLSYAVGKIMHNKVGMQINANCQNVFTVTKYKGIDPEIYGGMDNTIYPRPRTYTLGVNLQF